MKKYVGKTSNGFDVFFDTEKSHAITHFAHHPKLLEAVEKVIPSVEANEDTIRMDFELEEEVGTTDLVRTVETDEIVYAKRPLRTQYSRFVKNKDPMPTKWITIDLRKVNDTEYSLYTAFIGKLTPSFPGGDYLPDQSREFWSQHALVWGSQEVVPDSETTDCPW